MFILQRVKSNTKTKFLFEEGGKITTDIRRNVTLIYEIMKKANDRPTALEGRGTLYAVCSTSNKR